MREEPLGEGVGLGAANGEVLLEWLSLERREGILCGWVGTAVGRGGGRRGRRKDLGRRRVPEGREGLLKGREEPFFEERQVGPAFDDLYFQVDGELCERWALLHALSPVLGI